MIYKCNKSAKYTLYIHQSHNAAQHQCAMVYGMRLCLVGKGAHDGYCRYDKNKSEFSVNSMIPGDRVNIQYKDLLTE